MVAAEPNIEGAPPGVGEQTDFEKLRRIPFLYGFSVLNTSALLCTVAAPLTLYAAELGVAKNGIGLIGGVMPFAQVLCIGFLPLVMRFGHRHIAALGYGLRYLFVLPFLLAPLVRTSADLVFWILFGSMTMFAVGRTFAETALWPWSQEYTPRFLRGRVSGSTALFTLPAAIGVSYLVQLWLDSHTGIERFSPVFLVGIVLGLVGGSLLLGLGGGRPRPGALRGLDSIRAIVSPAQRPEFPDLSLLVGIPVPRIRRHQPVHPALLPGTAGHQFRQARADVVAGPARRRHRQRRGRLVRRPLRHAGHPHRPPGPADRTAARAGRRQQGHAQLSTSLSGRSSSSSGCCSRAPRRSARSTCSTTCRRPRRRATWRWPMPATA